MAKVCIAPSDAYNIAARDSCMAMLSYSYIASYVIIITFTSLALEGVHKRLSPAVRGTYTRSQGEPSHS